jgi:hypothetical protein
MSSLTDDSIFPLNYLRASRMLCYTLVNGTSDHWADASKVWIARLTEDERCHFGWSVLRTLSPDLVNDVAAAAHPFAGSPLPTLLNAADDARWWASMASNDERCAYSAASVQLMSASQRRAFQDALSEAVV